MFIFILVLEEFRFVDGNNYLSERIFVTLIAWFGFDPGQLSPDNKMAKIFQKTLFFLYFLSQVQEL